MSEERFSENKSLDRFEYSNEGGVTYAACRRQDGTLYIDYVEAPPQLRGTGAAGKLMEYVVSRAQAENLKIVPVCGYAASWLRRHGAATGKER